MHPSLLEAFVEASVEELRTRLDAHPELVVSAVDLDMNALKLNVVFDHVEHATELVQAQSTLLLPSGAAVTKHQRIPILGRSSSRRLILHMGLDGYDLEAPTAELLDERGEPLPANQWPTSFAGAGIVNDHPIYKRPFFCRRGFREYHEHQQHEDDPWAQWRDVLPLHAVVIELLTDLRVRWYGAA